MLLKKLPTQRPPPPEKEAPALSPKTAELDAVPQATATGTWFAVVGCALTAAFVAGSLPSSQGRFAAITTGISLLLSLYCDVRVSLRNLIRADILALVAFYFLTFFEFLFPQPHFDEMITLESAHRGIIAIEIGFIGMLLGRHLWKPRERPLKWLLTTEVPPHILIIIFWSCVAVGYLHMMIAVDFNFVEMVKFFMEARFTQPWSRGKLGDWKALIIELGMFIYLIPPLAGIILARRERYNVVNLVLVAAGLLFTLFYGFTSGTRNIFASYLVTLLIGYAFALPQRRRAETVTLGFICFGMMVVATPVMLAFRTVGFKNWISPTFVAPPESGNESVFVDYNLYAICKIMEVFPEKADYLGWEIPYTALIRPIPRAIWPGKPEGLSFTIEEALGVEGLTISATYVGEAYMAGGFVAVLLIALFFGAITGWWSYLGSSLNSELGILIYASGFFSAVISMRSLFVMTTAMLPTVAAIVLGTLVVKQILKLEARLQARRELRANQIARGTLHPTRR